MLAPLVVAIGVASATATMDHGSGCPAVSSHPASESAAVEALALAKRATTLAGSHSASLDAMAPDLAPTSAGPPRSDELAMSAAYALAPETFRLHGSRLPQTATVSTEAVDSMAEDLYRSVSSGLVGSEMAKYCSALLVGTSLQPVAETNSLASEYSSLVTTTNPPLATVEMETVGRIGAESHPLASRAPPKGSAPLAEV